jgi:uncharacterized protein
MKKTVVIGASDNENRYSNMATKRLLSHGHEVFPIGIRKGKINDLEIITEKPMLKDIDTVTMYVGTQNQDSWIDYIISLNPKRIIFNPGTENDDFENLANTKGIETVEGCTLVMLSVGTF